MSKIFQTKEWAELNSHLNPIWINGYLFFRIKDNLLYAKGNVSPLATKENFVIKMCHQEYPGFYKYNKEFIADLTKENKFSKWTRKIIRKAEKEGYIIKENIDMIYARELYMKNFKDSFPDSYWFSNLFKSVGIYKDEKLLGFMTYMNYEDESYVILHAIDKENIKEGNYLLVSKLFDILRVQGIKKVSCGDACNDGLAGFKKRFYDEVLCYDYTNDWLRKIKWRLFK